MSIPRIQFTGVSLLILAGAFGAGRLTSSLASLAKRRWVATALGLVVFVNSVLTIPGIWAMTNPDDEEELIQKTLTLLPQGPFVLIRRDWKDPPLERTPLYFPDYLFESPAARGIAAPLSLAGDYVHTDIPVFFFLNTRCYLRDCGSSGPHPACMKVLEDYDTVALLELSVPVRQLPLGPATGRRGPAKDQDFPWCVAGDHMDLGIYRLLGPRKHGG